MRKSATKCKASARQVQQRATMFNTSATKCKVQASLCNKVHWVVHLCAPVCNKVHFPLNTSATKCKVHTSKCIGVRLSVHQCVLGCASMWKSATNCNKLQDKCNSEQKSSPRLQQSAKCMRRCATMWFCTGVHVSVQQSACVGVQQCATRAQQASECDKVHWGVQHKCNRAQLYSTRVQESLTRVQQSTVLSLPCDMMHGGKCLWYLASKFRKAHCIASQPIWNLIVQGTIDQRAHIYSVVL